MTKYLLNGFNNFLETHRRYTEQWTNSTAGLRMVLHLFRYFHSLHPYLGHQYDFTYYKQ